MDVLDVLGYIMDEIDVDSFINPEIGCFCGFPSNGCLGNCYFAKKISENHYQTLNQFS